MKKIIMMALIATISLTGCAQNSSSNSSKTSDSGVEKNIKRISKVDFQALLNDSVSFQLIDVRTPQEFKTGSIEGAQNIDYNNPSFSVDIEALDKNIPVLIFCRSGGRSARALKVFEANGFTTVFELEGGYLNWTK